MNAGFSISHEPVPCVLKTLVHSVQVLNIQTGELMADFQYDVTEAVTDNPRIVCLIVQGLKGGVYYFNSQDVCSPRFIFYFTQSTFQAAQISSILATNIRNAGIRDDGKLAQLMQDDEFIAQLQRSPEFQQALADG